MMARERRCRVNCQLHWAMGRADLTMNFDDILTAIAAESGLGRIAAIAAPWQNNPVSSRNCDHVFASVKGDSGCQFWDRQQCPSCWFGVMPGRTRSMSPPKRGPSPFQERIRCGEYPHDPEKRVRQTCRIHLSESAVAYLESLLNLHAIGTEIRKIEDDIIDHLRSRGGSFLKRLLCTVELIFMADVELKQPRVVIMPNLLLIRTFGLVNKWPRHFPT